MASQNGWRWCSKCQGMFYAEDQLAQAPSHKDYGSCPAESDPGLGHDPVGSGKYVLLVGDDDSPGEQSGWRKCTNCKGLYYSGNSSGICHKTGGGHFAEDTAKHLKMMRDKGGTLINAQRTWRFCNKCQGFWYSGNGDTHNFCPNPTPSHGHTDSGGQYTVMFESAEFGPPPNL